MPRNPDGTYTITNPSTGEKKVVQPSELSQYGLSDPSTQGSAIVPNMSGVKVDTVPQGMQYPSQSPDQMTFSGGMENTLNNGLQLGQGLLNLPKRIADSGAYQVLPGMQGMQKNINVMNAKTPQEKIAALSASNDNGGKFFEDMAKGVLKSYADTFGVSAKKDPNSVLPEISVDPQAAVKHAYDKPVDTALNLLPIIGGLSKMGKAGEAGVVAEDASKMGLGEKMTQAGEDVTRGIRQVKMPGKGYVGAAQDEAAVNSTLDKLGFSGTPQQQYEMLQPKMTQIESQIRPIIQSKPQVFTPDQIKNDILTQMDNQGLLIGEDAKTAAAGAVDDIMKDVVNKGGADAIPGEDLFNAKQKLNDIRTRIKAKADKGTALTPKEEALMASRDALDGVITQYYPEVKDLTTQQSHLFDAAPSLSSARFNPPTLRVMGNSIPAQVSIKGQQIGGEALKMGGAGMSALEQANPLNKSGGQAALATLPAIENSDQQTQGVQTPLDNTNSQKNLNNVPEQGNPFGTSGNPTPSPQALPPITTLTGHTPEENYAAYQKAQASGNTAAASQLYKRFEDETAYQKTQGGGKTLSATGAKQITDIQSGQNLLDNLDKALTTYQDKLGPVRGRIGSANVQDTDAQAFQSQVNLAAQVVGRAIEGGVLRKEDEEKYKKILPQLTDTPAVARRKLENVRGLLKTQLQLSQQNYPGAQDVGTYLPQIQ